MKKIKLEIAYDGTDYCGWQTQPGLPSIEETVNHALSELLGEKIRMTGASRTDSGVHALGNVAVFRSDTRIPAEKISYALNQRLPEEIRIQDSCEVPECFHPRYDAKKKRYCYRILNSTFALPTERLYSHFFYTNLDIDKMKKGAAYLLGSHDFKGYCSARTTVENTVRTIFSLEVLKTGNIIEVEVEGNGFLYNMVRIIAGTLIKIGTGEWKAEQAKEALEKMDRSLAGPTAPARGLTLMKIFY